MPAKKTAKRYTEDQKTDILAFIEKFNAENGRGGQTAAVKKYGVTPLTRAAWSKKSAKKPKKAGKSCAEAAPHCSTLPLKLPIATTKNLMAADIRAAWSAKTYRFTVASSRWPMCLMR